MNHMRGGMGVNTDDVQERIKAAMAELRPHRLDAYTLKTKRLKFRLHDAEFEEIQETAESLGLSIAEYFCTLHRYAVKQLTPDPASSQWVHPEPHDRPHRRHRRE